MQLREVPARQAASAPVWLVAGQMIIDRDPRPSMVVDAQGMIRAVNRALRESHAAPPTELVGVRWVDAWPFDCEGAKAAAGAMQAATDGRISHVTLGTTTPQGDTAISLFELSPLGDDPDRVFIVSVLSTKLAAKTESAQPAGGLHYEVEPDTLQLRRVWSADPQARPSEGLCHEVIHGQPTRCEGCPALLVAETPGAAVRRVLPRPSSRLHLDVVDARRTPTGSVAMSAWEVGEDLLSELVSAKVSVLARRARLSERERNVLDMLLLGRSHAEIATVLGITARTVKYHQGRLQAKLGVESRVDLVRVVL